MTQAGPYKPDYLRRGEVLSDFREAFSTAFRCFQHCFQHFQRGIQEQLKALEQLNLVLCDGAMAEI